MNRRSREMFKRSDVTVRDPPTVGERSTPWLKRLRGRLLLALVLGVGASLIGPYGTYLTFDPILRSIYWIAILIGGFAIWWVLEIVVQKLAGKQTFAIEYALIIPPFAAINSGFVLVLNRGLGSMFGFTIPVDWTELLVSHMLLSFLVILPILLLIRVATRQAEAQGGMDAIDFLLQKMPPHLRGTLPHALAAEGHYVRVYAGDEDHLVQMSFEDAVLAVAGIDGYRTHRSWWIALKEVEEIIPVGSAYEAKLKNGARIPVSRRKSSALRAALKSIDCSAS